LWRWDGWRFRAKHLPARELLDVPFSGMIFKIANLIAQANGNSMPRQSKPPARCFVEIDAVKDTADGCDCLAV